MPSRKFDTSVRVTNNHEGYSVTIEATSADNGSKVAVSETKVYADLTDLTDLMQSVIQKFEQEGKL